MPEESTGELQIEDLFREHSKSRKLIGLRPKQIEAMVNSPTVQAARDAAMEARAYLSSKFPPELIETISLTLLGPIALPSVAFTESRLPSEEMATRVARMHHQITHSIYAATQEGADPSLIIAVGEMLAITDAIKTKDPGAFRLFSKQESGIRAAYAAIRLFSDSTAEDGTTFKAYLPDYGPKSNEVYRWDIKSETDVVFVAQRGSDVSAMSADIKGTSLARGSHLTVMDAAATANYIRRFDSGLRTFLLEQGRGNVRVATINISTRDLNPFVPVDIPRKNVNSGHISQVQQAIRNFATLPIESARSIINTASKF